VNAEDNRITLLLEEDEEKRYEAARQMLREQPPAFETLLEWTADPRPRLREMACFCLREQDWTQKTSVLDAPFLYPEAIPTLVHLLETDPEPEVRASAVAALGFFENTERLPVLLRAISDPDENIRYQIAVALGRFGETQWERDTTYREATRTALLQLMDDEDEDVRDWATFGIHQGDHDTPETRARLWKALDDENYDVRGEAAEGLAKFGDRTLIPRLEELLRDKEELSPCFFHAAELLAEPSLLPAVLQAAETWKSWNENGHLHFYGREAIEALEKIQAEQSCQLTVPEEAASNRNEIL
jgi:HEAT repeat protein